MKAVKVKLTTFPKNPPESRLAFIDKVLEEQKELLVKRIEFFESIGVGDNSAVEQPPPPRPAKAERPPPPSPAKPVETPSVTPTGKSKETTTGTAGAAASGFDDGFKDDIPAERTAGEKGKRKKPLSLSEEFQNRIQDKKADRAVAAGGTKTTADDTSAAVSGEEELDIF
jgi:hypothetical protein